MRRTRATSLTCAAAVFAVAMTAAPRARADDLAAAEQLFLEGKRLMAEGRYEPACEKLKAAHDLDKTATGTLLNLALCHEEIKRTATAWAEFRQVIGESSGRREDRVAMARAHEAKLAPLLSFITVRVSPGARIPGLRIEMDGTRAIAEASWGVELPVDPGKHLIDVSAPNTVGRSLEIVAGDTADKQTIDIPVLASVPVAEQPPPARAVSPPPIDTARTRRTVGYVLGGIGLASIGVGAVFGALAMSKKGDADDAAAKCPNHLCPREAERSNAVDTLANADRTATVANVAAGVGIGMLAAGVVLVLTAKPATAPAAVPPRIGFAPRPDGATLSFAGAW